MYTYRNIKLDRAQKKKKKNKTSSSVKRDLLICSFCFVKNGRQFRIDLTVVVKKKCSY